MSLLLAAVDDRERERARAENIGKSGMSGGRPTVLCGPRGKR
jgi:hypothetical protein